MTILDFLREHNVPLAPAGHRHVGRGWIGVDCVWCSPGSGGFHLGINERWGAVSCWKCGKHRLGETLRELTGASWNEIRDVVKGVRESAPPPEHKVKVGGKVVYPAGYQDGLMGVHADYLKRRGFPPDEVEALWGLGSVGISPTHPWRILIPVHYRGEVVTWTTRSIDDRAEPRYLTAKPSEEKVHSREVLYGWDFCRDTVVVVEGPLDVIAGGPGCVCGLGVNLSLAQVARIATFPKRVVCLDGDAAGRRAAAKLVEQLACFDGETIDVVLETGKDLSRAKKSEVKKFREHFLE